MLPRSARRVQAALADAGIDAAVRELPDSTRTAPEAAAAVGCELGAIVKSRSSSASATRRSSRS